MPVRQLVSDTHISIKSVRSNRLRTWITVGIIALGIMALIGILTAIEGLKSSIYQNFSGMGSNTFQVTSQMVRTSRRSNVSAPQKKISYQDARAFQERFRFPSIVSISMAGTSSARASFGAKETNPNIRVMGIDEHYINLSETKLTIGRNFSASEVHDGLGVCIIGDGVLKKLFDSKKELALQSFVLVGTQKYRIVGVAAPRGGGLMGSLDNILFVPLQKARAVYGGGASFVVSVWVSRIEQLPVAVEEAEGLFRVIRKVPLGSPSDFGIQTNDRLAEMVLENVSFVSGAALFIGLITLLGAAIGLMNIMLVSVVERTREIGIHKALGAKSSSIRRQFLFESLLISLIGGTIGVAFGIAIGNVVSLILKSGFVVPWLWVIFGFVLCTLVGLVSGVYPASKAAKLDPILALRYE